jgi:protein TonB
MNSDLLQTGLPPTNDRLLTTCFLAALFHGIVILGVTFSSSRSGADAVEPPALEVVLVDDRAPQAKTNPDAQYLAQRTQHGSGNGGEQTLIPGASSAPAERLGTPDGGGVAADRNGDSAGEDELLASPQAEARVVYFAPAASISEASQRPGTLEMKPDLDFTPNDDGIELRLRGASKQQSWVAADTRESDVAVYLNSWRRKVERVGSLNFPDAARRKKLSGTPVIEVTIGADGRLLASVIRRSSGHAEIDEAAIRILKLSAPYAPFPGALNAKHDEIRIAYEWQFLDGAGQDSRLMYSPSP